MHDRRDRAYLRAAAARKRAQRERTRRAERHWGFDLDLNELRDLVARAGRSRWGYRRYNIDERQLRELGRLIDSAPELAYAHVPMSGRVIELIGIDVLRIVASWQLDHYLGLDQRLSYYRLAYEPEWNKPDITAVGARSTRKRVWKRDEAIYDIEGDDYIPAQRLRPGIALYERFGGGEVKS